MLRIVSLGLTAFVFAAGASAQPGLSTKPNYDMIDRADRIDEGRQTDAAKVYNEGLTALRAMNFSAAESAFSRLERLNAQAPADTPFLTGLAKIGLEKWGEAESYLQMAVQAQPGRPEPITRLGLVYLKLNDKASASQQRAKLIDLDATCRKSCGDASWIAEGITVLDQAMQADASASRLSSASLAAVASSGADGAASAFDPAKYSLVTFSDTEDLYGLLTQEGRCPINATAAPRQPCALILYRPGDGAGTDLTSNFKPVFKIVNRKSIWAIHDKKLQKIRIEDLYYDNVEVIGGGKKTYSSVALVGNAENAANCQQGKLCLADLVTNSLFDMYRNMPDSVVDVIWGAGMKDVGTIRVR